MLLILPTFSIKYFDQLLGAALQVHVVYLAQLLDAVLFIHLISNHVTTIIALIINLYVWIKYPISIQFKSALFHQFLSQKLL